MARARKSRHLRGAAGCSERIEKGLEHARLAEAPEALPHRIPVSECLGQSAPGDVVDGEVVQRLEEETVVAALGAPPRAAGAEQLQHRRPESSSVIRVSMAGSSQTDPLGVTDPRTWESTHHILDPIRPHSLSGYSEPPSLSCDASLDVCAPRVSV